MPCDCVAQAAMDLVDVIKPSHAGELIVALPIQYKSCGKTARLGCQHGGKIVFEIGSASQGWHPFPHRLLNLGIENLTAMPLCDRIESKHRIFQAGGRKVHILVLRFASVSRLNSD